MPAPIRLAIANDYALVVYGLRRMLLPFTERVSVVELSTNKSVNTAVDIALFDSFGRDRDMLTAIAALSRNDSVDKVVLYTWAFAPEFITRALQSGAAGVLSKTLTGPALVAALEQIHSGQRVISPPPGSVKDIEPNNSKGSDWPGRSAGLTQREAEMLTLICRGHTNAEIAASAFLSPNSVKSYIRSAYRKVGVERRSQAVAWGIAHGLGQDNQDVVTPPDPPEDVAAG